MKKLYVIGNGFDIHHGLKTRYTDFYNYLKHYNSELVNTLDHYFYFKCDQQYRWTDFENDLCSFDHQDFFDSINNIDVLSESFKPSECFGLEDDLEQQTENLVQSLKDEFRDWIESIEYTEDCRTNVIYLEPDSVYLNFNYTDTLEEVYLIDKHRILYIHNNTNDLSGELIFGHAQVKETNPSPNQFDDEGEPTRTMFTDAENLSRFPYYAFKKDTKSVIKEHRQYFNKLNDVDEVIVLGHSLGRMDWPYFKLISKMTNNATWKISYYGNSEHSSKMADAKKMLGGRYAGIEMIKIADLQHLV